MTPQLKRTQRHVEDVLAELEEWFTPDTVLTLVARHQTNDEANLIFTRDDLRQVAALLLKRA